MGGANCGNQGNVQADFRELSRTGKRGATHPHTVHPGNAAEAKPEHRQPMQVAVQEVGASDERGLS